MSHQTQSLFFRLPLELRQTVYRHYLHQAPFQVPENEGQINSTRALLLTCRSTHAEAKEYVLSHVEWTFISTNALLRFLIAIPLQQRQQLRHICVRHDEGILLDLSSFIGHFFAQPMRCTLPSILPLFPGLQLDTLTVAEMRLLSLDTITKYLNTEGWRNLTLRVKPWLADEPFVCLEDWHTTMRVRDGNVQVFVRSNPRAERTSEQIHLRSPEATNDEESRYELWDANVALQINEFAESALHLSIRNSLSQGQLPLRDQVETLILGRRNIGADVAIAEAQKKPDHVTIALRRGLGSNGGDWDTFLALCKPAPKSESSDE